VAFLRPKTSRKFSPGFLPISTHAFCANIPGLMSEPAMVAVDLAECDRQGRRIEPSFLIFPKGGPSLLANSRSSFGNRLLPFIGEPYQLRIAANNNA
jgi:hypothetical protein